MSDTHRSLTVAALIDAAPI